MVASSLRRRVAAGSYARRQPEGSVLRRVVREALPAFRATLAERDERALPGFVEREIERFTACGELSAGFARFRCLYHGVLAAHARLRPRVVRFRRPRTSPATHARVAPAPATPRNPRWADLMRRGLDLDVLACPRCGGRMTHLATILEPTIVRRILDHLGLAPPTSGPRPRAPPSSSAPPSKWLRARLERLSHAT